jgi:hypothetical protein
MPLPLRGLHTAALRCGFGFRVFFVVLTLMCLVLMRLVMRLVMRSGVVVLWTGALGALGIGAPGGALDVHALDVDVPS